MAAPQQNMPSSPLLAQPYFLVDVNGNPLTGLIHNADNQAITNLYSLFTSGVNQVMNPIFNANRQIEVGADGQPSHGIAASSQNLRQTQSSNATGAITLGQLGSVIITPTTMTSGMVPNNEVDIDVGTASQEPGYIIATTSTTITVQPQNGSPTAPAWKFAHSGTYKIQVGVYTVERDIIGEGSGFRGDGMPPAVEVEWNAGGPPLASGVPSLDQYDRESLILAGNTDSQACNSTTAGDTVITLTSAKTTLLPLMPVRLTGAALSETVYVDQSYIIGNNTVIALKHPVVNTGQVLATWQKYTPDGPGTGDVMLYGEGMEGILLANPGKPGFGKMMHANYDNIVLAASQGFAIGTTNGGDQTNVHGKGAVIFLNITVINGGTIILTIQGKDPVTGLYYAIMTDAFAITANGFYTFEIYPGATPITSTSGTAPGSGAMRTAVSHVLPKTWRYSALVATAIVTAQITTSVMAL